MSAVVQERAKWRDRIRQLAVELHEAVSEKDQKKVGRLRIAFRLSLNPWDERDREITALLDQLVAEHPDEALMERLVIRLELLLKFDWERAKDEATWSVFRRAGSPGRRAATARSGVSELAKFRSRRPLDATFRERDEF